MSENQDRKVIPLKPKVKPKSRELLMSDLKSTAAGTMAFILLLVVSFNFSIFESTVEVEKQKKLQRGLASLSKTSEVDWKKNIESLNKEMIAQTAKRPTAADSLTFGHLAGKYSIVSDNGRVTQIKLNQATSEATLVRDRFEFIESYADAFAPGLSSIRKMSVQKNSQGRKEVYQVQTASGESTFKFQITNENQLLSLVVE